MPKSDRVITGHPCLDKVLEGGFEPGKLAQRLSPLLSPETFPKTTQISLPVDGYLEGEDGELHPFYFETECSCQSDLRRFAEEYGLDLKILDDFGVVHILRDNQLQLYSFAQSLFLDGRLTPLQRLQYCLLQVEWWQEGGGYSCHVEEEADQAIDDLKIYGLW